MSARLKSLMSHEASTEDHEDNEVVTEETVELAYAHLELAEDALEAEQNDVDELNEMHDALEDMIEDMQYANQNGGMDPIAATFMQHAYDRFTLPLGLQSADESMPTVEDFGSGDSGRQAATEVSTEAAGSTLSKIWNAIKKAVMSMVNAVRNFFKNVFSATDKIHKRVKQLTEETKKLSSAKLKSNDAKLTVSGAETIKFKGKVGASDVVSGLQNLVKVNSPLMGKKYLNEIESYYKEVASQIKAANKDEEPDEGKVKSFFSKVVGVVKDFVTSTESAVNTDLTFSGDMTFDVESKTKGGGEGEDEMATIKVELKEAEGASKVSDKKVDPYSISDSGKILEQCDQILQQIAASKTQLESANNSREEMLKTLKSDMEGNKASQMWQTAKGKSALRSAQKDMMRPINKIVSHDMKVLKAAASTVAANNKLYEAAS